MLISWFLIFGYFFVRFGFLSCFTWIWSLRKVSVFPSWTGDRKMYTPCKHSNVMIASNRRERMKRHLSPLLSSHNMTPWFLYLFWLADDCHRDILGGKSEFLSLVVLAAKQHTRFSHPWEYDQSDLCLLLKWDELKSKSASWLLVIIKLHESACEKSNLFPSTCIGKTIILCRFTKQIVSVTKRAPWKVNFVSLFVLIVLVLIVSLPASEASYHSTLQTRLDIWHFRGSLLSREGNWNNEIFFPHWKGHQI